MVYPVANIGKAIVKHLPTNEDLIGCIKKICKENGIRCGQILSVIGSIRHLTIECIVASEEKAKSISKKPVWILGVGAATTSVNLAGRDLFTGLTVAEQAAQQAYQMAGVGPKDIDVAEVHDCFTIAEMMAYENLGFAKPGEGKELIRSKETYQQGSIPVNVDGGLLSKGHPSVPPADHR